MRTITLRDKRFAVLSPIKIGVGDTVYSFCDTYKKIFEYIIEEMHIFVYDDRGDNVKFSFTAYFNGGSEFVDCITFDYGDIDKTIFFTYGSAKEALKGGLDNNDHKRKAGVNSSYNTNHI